MKKLLLFAAIILIPLFIIGSWWYGNLSTSNTETQVVSAYEQEDTNTMELMYASMKGDEFDKAYLADMIAHHQGALNMAGWAVNQATKQEIRTLANNILSSQSSEIRQMLEWQQQWAGTANGNDPHASHAAEMATLMGEEMAKMEAKLVGRNGEAYDKEFLTQMILHHQQAVDMSKYAESNAERQEIKDLANTVIAAQEKEIADMKSWQQMWGY